MHKRPSEEESVWTRALFTVAPLLATIAVLLVGLVLAKPRSEWLIAALTVAVALVTSILVTMHLSKHYGRRLESFIENINDLVSEHLEEIKQLAGIRAEGARSGWTQERLSEYESRLDVKTIWIVGANFESEIASDSPFRNVVRDNIEKREIKYVYIAPEKSELRHMFDTLREELGLQDDDSRLKTLLLSEDKWERMPYREGNFTIYDPVGKGRHHQAFCWDPGGDGDSFIELRHQIDKWIWRIQDVCPELDPKRSNDKIYEEPGGNSVPLSPDGQAQQST